MRLFTCATCKQVLFFENHQCTRCGHALAYLPDRKVVSALVPAKEEPAGAFVVVGGATTQRYRLCANYVEHAACNWAIPEAEVPPDGLCRACTFNDVIPDLSDPAAKEAWRRIEGAKRRLLYTLIELGLPLETKAEMQPPPDPAAAPAGDGAEAPRPGPKGLAFSFLKAGESQPVFTGHCDGLITLNIAEADDPFREKMRQQMGETYRTLLGHFRHEIGHYYWSRLVEDTEWLEPCRERFGDDRADYKAALERHYEQGAPADWGARHVSAYASMHPWEDFAETWAHYLHMVDTLESARSYGLALKPKAVGGAALETVTARRLDFDDFDDLITAWIPLTIALNSLNRAMGLRDAYPFVLGEVAITKLRFVHDVIERSAASRRTVGA